jgi:hypothetical protein
MKSKLTTTHDKHSPLHEREWKNGCQMDGKRRGSDCHVINVKAGRAELVTKLINCAAASLPARSFGSTTTIFQTTSICANVKAIVASAILNWSLPLPFLALATHRTSGQG